MTNSADFASLYVERPAITNQLVNHLLQQTTDPRYIRSLAVQAPSRSGKSSILRDIKENKLPHYPQHPIILSVDRHVFERGFSNPEDLFLPVIQDLWAAVEVYCTQHLAVANANHLPRPSGNSAQIRNDLSFLAKALDQTTPKPYIIILVDGMDEIVEISMALAKQDERLIQRDLLYRFEETFIGPLFRYQNVRMLSTCRSGTEVQWRTFKVRPLNKLEMLDSFTLAGEQFDRLRDKTNGDPATSQPITLSFLEVKSQLQYYQWSNPGANAYLFTAAFGSGGTIDKQIIDACLDYLLTSPTNRQPLSDNRKAQLRHIIKTLPQIDGGVKSVDVGYVLRLEDAARNDFMSELTSRGVAQSKGYTFKIDPEVVALVLDWHSKP